MTNWTQPLLQHPTKTDAAPTALQYWYPYHLHQPSSFIITAWTAQPRKRLHYIKGVYTCPKRYITVTNKIRTIAHSGIQFRELTFHNKAYYNKIIATTNITVFITYNITVMKQWLTLTNGVCFILNLSKELIHAFSAQFSLVAKVTRALARTFSCSITLYRMFQIDISVIRPMHLIHTCKTVHLLLYHWA